MFLLQRVSSVADSISNKVLRSVLAYPNQRLPFPLLCALIALNDCLSSLPFITAFRECLSSLPVIIAFHCDDIQSWRHSVV